MSQVRILSFGENYVMGVYIQLLLSTWNLDSDYSVISDAIIFCSAHPQNAPWVKPMIKGTWRGWYVQGEPACSEIFGDQATQAKRPHPHPGLSKMMMAFYLLVLRIYSKRELWTLRWAHFPGVPQISPWPRASKQQLKDEARPRLFEVLCELWLCVRGCPPCAALPSRRSEGSLLKTVLAHEPEFRIQLCHSAFLRRYEKF